ncbi:MAG: DUF952 domain-containing protein [Kofleriaceae bacterium]
MLFHITTRDAWQHAVGLGDYCPPSLDREGFIHLSTEQQWEKTRERFFANQSDLVLLVIDPERVGSIRWEAADGDSFPHLYSALSISAVVEVREL